MPKKTRAKTTNTIPRHRANSGPTDETFLQCGHLARALLRVLKMKVSWQCAHVTRHIPGTLGRDGLTGEGDKLMILLQLGRGQAIRWEELLQIRRQLHGQRTYFLPGGAFFMGVASLHWVHLTTCWSTFPEMSIIA